MAEAKKGQLFIYAILFHPKPKKVGDDTQVEPSELLIPPTEIVARSQEEAAMKAARAVPQSHEDRLDQVEIVLKPF